MAQAATLARPVDPNSKAVALIQKKKQFLILKNLKKYEDTKKWFNYDVDEDDETAVQFKTWLNGNHVNGFTQHSAGILDTLRFAGILQSVLLDPWMRPVATVATSAGFAPKAWNYTDPETGAVTQINDNVTINEIGEKDTKILFFNDTKWIRSGPARSGPFWIGKSADKPARLLFVGRLWKEKVAGWTAQFQTQSYAPTMILCSYDASVGVDKCGQQEIIDFCTGTLNLPGSAKFRMQTSTLAALGEDICLQLQKTDDE